MKRARFPKPIKLGTMVKYLGREFKKVTFIDKEREYIQVEGDTRWLSPCGLSSYTNKIKKEK